MFHALRNNPLLNPKPIKFVSIVKVCKSADALVTSTSPIVKVCKSPDALVTSTNPIDPKAEWNCSKCQQKTNPEEINAIENR